MGLLSIALVGAGMLMIVMGAQRASGPYKRYQALKAQDQNIARYEAWRGGVRNDSKTGASVAMDMLRRQAQVGGVIVILGFVAVIAGFMVR